MADNDDEALGGACVTTDGGRIATSGVPCNSLAINVILEVQADL